jgi:hypothetical protein
MSRLAAMTPWAVLAAASVASPETSRVPRMACPRHAGPSSRAMSETEEVSLFATSAVFLRVDTTICRVVSMAAPVRSPAPRIASVLNP